MHILALGLLFSVLCFANAATFSTIGCYYNSTTKEYKTENNVARNDTKYIAWLSFNDTLFTVGWGQIHLHTNTHSNTVSDEIVMYCAGLIEGMATVQRISDALYISMFNLYEDLGSDLPENLVDYIRKNMEYSHSKAEANRNQPWYQHAHLAIVHTDAMYDGYYRAKKSIHVSPTPIDWWIYQSAGDMDDILVFIELENFKKTGKRRSDAPQNSKLRQPFSDQWYDVHHHCSAIVFATPDFSDVYVSHDSWTKLNDMNRMLKDYDLGFSSALGGTQRFLFSSQPGRTISMDDFWQTSSDLVVIETTLHNWNNTLYEEKCSPMSFFSWIRVQVANRMAKTGKEWCTNFVNENSGTYNNQYIAVDYKKFRPGKTQPADFVWAVEQLPGYYHMDDRTQELNTNRYIPSLNTPYFEDVYNLAMYPEKVNETGCDYWTYWDNSRMHIYARDVPLIKNYTDFQKFMRSNDYQNDPLTNYDPAEAVMSRYDLRPDSCINMCNSKMCPNAFGGTDSKSTNYLNVMYKRFDCISSPQYETQPAWEFGVGKWEELPYVGLPAKWTFPWIVFGQDD